MSVLTVQPAEIAKAAIVVYFANSISRKKDQMRTFRYGVLPYAILLVLVAGLVAQEPHLSGAILILCAGRAVMLVGVMENASSVLQEGLLVAGQPSDSAMAYYQLAYVLWKAGRPQAGAVCYVKSLMTSSSMALQATAELQELVEETGVPLPAREAVDEELAAHAVPVAPTTEVIEALGSAAAAATDAGLFPVARNLLALRLRYRPDDALVNVLRSLGE